MASSSSSLPPYASSNSKPLIYANQAELLEDLSSRFVLNLPDEELASLERMGFQCEQAHWFYEDFVVKKDDPRFPSLSLKKFIEILFKTCPLLQRWSHDHEQAFNHFMEYKTRVPVCGAIMLNDKLDKCVLVKGWKSSSGWGFPKGKINQNELPHSCAIREVLEETGYDLGQQLHKDDYICMSIKDQSVTLYIVPGVPEDYPFQTKTRKEISKIEWFNLADLPNWRRNSQVSGKFYLITPFIPELKEFVNASKRRRRQAKQNSKVKHTGDRSAQMDGDRSTDADESLQDALDSIHYDFDAQGSSSSGADNDLETPSPQSIEATPVVEAPSDHGLEAQGIVDDHFARLLSNLTSSAKELQLGITSSISPAASSTPTPADSPVKLSQSSSPSVISAAKNKESGAQRPTSSSTSSNTLISPPRQNSEIDARRMKYLALLESLTNESIAPLPPSMPQGQATFTNTGNAYLGPPPPHPSSVPPPFAPLDQRFLDNSSRAPPHGYRNFINPHVQLPVYQDPIQGRPMTSNSVMTPSLSQRRLTQHGPAASLHQGNLLSILGANAGPPRPIQEYGSPVPGMVAPMQSMATFRPAGNMMPPQAGPGGFPPQNGRLNGMNSLAVVPPPMRAVQNGPLTAPLLQQQAPAMNGVHPNGLLHAPPNKAQLLSILTPNGAGAGRPFAHPCGYSTGGM